MNIALNNISNGWIIGCSILTCGIMTCSYLDGINNILLIHIKRKFKLQLQEIDTSNEDKLISYYWKHSNIMYVTGITGLTIIVLNSMLKDKNK